MIINVDANPARATFLPALYIRNKIDSSIREYSRKLLLIQANMVLKNKLLMLVSEFAYITWKKLVKKIIGNPYPI